MSKRNRGNGNNNRITQPTTEVTAVSNNNNNTDQEITMKNINVTEAIENQNTKRTQNSDDKKAIKNLNGQLKDITRAINDACKGVKSEAERQDIAAQFQPSLSKVNHKLEELTTKDSKFNAESVEAVAMVTGDALGAVLESPVRGAMGFFSAMKNRATGNK